MQVKIAHKTSGQSMKVLGSNRRKNGYLNDGPRMNTVGIIHTNWTHNKKTIEPKLRRMKNLAISSCARNVLLISWGDLFRSLVRVALKRFSATTLHKPVVVKNGFLFYRTTLFLHKRSREVVVWFRRTFSCSDPVRETRTRAPSNHPKHHEQHTQTQTHTNTNVHTLKLTQFWKSNMPIEKSSFTDSTIIDTISAGGQSAISWAELRLDQKTSWIIHSNVFVCLHK